jgi:hypothetical protein
MDLAELKTKAALSGKNGMPRRKDHKKNNDSAMS